MSGTAFPGKLPYRTKADGNGEWAITLAADTTTNVPLAGAFKLTLAGEGGLPITAENVVFGDVFLCTGQSNMEKTVSYSYNGTVEIPIAGEPSAAVHLPPLHESDIVHRLAGACVSTANGAAR